jgi:hypothetical protein
MYWLGKMEMDLEDIFLTLGHSDDILGARMLWKPKEARIL